MKCPGLKFRAIKYDRRRLRRIVVLPVIVMVLYAHTYHFPSVPLCPPFVLLVRASLRQAIATMVAKRGGASRFT